MPRRIRLTINPSKVPNNHPLLFIVHPTMKPPVRNERYNNVVLNITRMRLGSCSWKKIVLRIVMVMMTTIISIPKIARSPREIASKCLFVILCCGPDPEKLLRNSGQARFEPRKIHLVNYGAGRRSAR